MLLLHPGVMATEKPPRRLTLLKAPRADTEGPEDSSKALPTDCSHLLSICTQTLLLSHCLPWHSSTQTFSTSLSLPWLWRFDTLVERIWCLFWMKQPLKTPFKGGKLRKEVSFPELLKLCITLIMFSMSISFLISTLNQFFSVRRRL